MKITNVEKFRNELYEAIEDTCEWTVDTPSEYPPYSEEWDNEELEVIEELNEIFNL